MSGPRKRKIALLGYMVEAMEAAQTLGYEFLAVVPPDFVGLLEADGIEAVGWDFGKINEHSTDLAKQLKAAGVTLAVPFYEETVEWAGALNAQFLDNPRIFNRSLLFRDKAMMKRKAQMSGIRVGVFEEVDNAEHARKFYRRVNEALVKITGDDPEPVHLKPISAAGSVGHYMVKTLEQIDELPADIFPCLAESHLAGQEFSCEVFIKDGVIRFLNINEYIHLGYSQLLPPTPGLEKYRHRIRAEVEKLITAFGFRDGVLHPEYFLDTNEELNFGEVANRVPGGHIFELIQRAYGFNPFAGMILCSDPDTTDEELAEFFPDERKGRLGYAGNILIYPRQKYVKELSIPEELLKEKYYHSHDLFEPVTSKVADRVGFGNHYGKVNFFGDDADRLREVLLHFETLDYYV